MEIEHLTADGFETSMRAMRNPLNSWSKSDSGWGIQSDGIDTIKTYNIGAADLDLAHRLIDAGPEHSKFLRQINASFDINAPWYMLKEFDTYKVGTTCNSCSTMHKVHAKEFEIDDFEYEFMYSKGGDSFETMDWLVQTIELLNRYRNKYLETHDKYDWLQMIKILPSSYKQRRTISCNYAVLRNMVKQRKNHKLKEWHDFIDALHELPYADDLIFYGLED